MTILCFCPSCDRIYADEDFCTDCTYEGHPDDDVELEVIGDFSSEQLINAKAGGIADTKENV